MQNNDFMLKKDFEIEKIKIGAKIVDETYEMLLNHVKGGQTEIEVSDFIFKVFKEKGADDVSFPTIVAFGENGAEPHHVPGERKLQKGDMVTVDMGVIVDGYCSDFTRTFAYGQPNQKMIEIYEAVKISQQLGLMSAKDGVECVEVDRICRNSIEKAGYGLNFVHGTGHGVGKEIHEDPFLNRSTDQILAKSMVVTIEPGIYVEGLGGVRIEDMIVIGEDKPVSNQTRDLIIV